MEQSHWDQVTDTKMSALVKPLFKGTSVLDGTATSRALIPKMTYHHSKVSDQFQLLIFILFISFFIIAMQTIFLILSSANVLSSPQLSTLKGDSWDFYFYTVTSLGLSYPERELKVVCLCTYHALICFPKVIPRFCRGTCVFVVNYRKLFHMGVVQ